MKVHYIIILLVTAISFFTCKDDGAGTDMNIKPSLSILSAEFFEGNANNIVAVTVKLSGENRTNVLVNYATIDGTAIAGSDYVGTSDGELVFSSSQTEKTINITIKGDDFNEGDETFEILLLNPSNATLTAERATITIKNDDSPSNDIIPSGGYSTPTSYEGMTLVWADEFQGNTLNESDWTFEIGTGSGGWGNNELQYYKLENTSIYDNEYLLIEAKEENVAGSSYTSSRLVTKDKKEFQYGRIDIRAALPEGQGLWPALWMLGHNIGEDGWPACGEIDIMELVGHAPNQIHGTVHYGTDFGQHQYTGGSSLTSDGSKFSEQFHVFSIIWKENSIQFLLDDVQYYSVTSNEMLGGQPYPFNQDFFFVFNVAVGGDWPGSPDATTIFPQRMAVDYVRVFQ